MQHPLLTSSCGDKGDGYQMSDGSETRSPQKPGPWWTAKWEPTGVRAISGSGTTCTNGTTDGTKAGTTTGGVISCGWGADEGSGRGEKDFPDAHKSSNSASIRSRSSWSSTERRLRPGSTGVTVGEGTNGAAVTAGHTDDVNGHVVITPEPVDEGNWRRGTDIEGETPEKEEEDLVFFSRCNGSFPTYAATRLQHSFGQSLYSSQRSSDEQDLP